MDGVREAAAEEASDPRRVLRAVFGFDSFRDNQEEAIRAALAGRDSLVLMPTGGGKSLCYQVPALLREGTALVISPLIALMQDQVSALHELGIEAAFLNSSLTPEGQRAIVARLRAGNIKLLYVAPERVVQPATQALLQSVGLSIIAIDEAHCVSQWGHDFRQDYLALDGLGELFPGVPRMALTATATPRTRREIVERLALDDPQVFVSSFDRPNIRYSVQPKTDARRQLLRFLAGREGQAGIVYCLTRKKVETTVEWLNAEGFTALPYHAGLSAQTREANQRRFLSDDPLIVVATIAFGMGIDKPDVRFVAHLDLPKSLESYYQETGRAGRDGKPADAWMTYGLQDVVRLRQIAEESTAEEQYKRHERQKLDALLGWCEAASCRRQPLLEYFGDSLAPGREQCGNCDVCLDPPQTVDGTEAAQKLLSAVYRSGQRFGAAHVVDILLGKSTDKVLQNRHDSLSVFGIGTELDAGGWRSAIRQLVVQGHLRVDPERYGALVLTPSSRGVLRGETPIRLREEPPTARATPRTKKARTTLAAVPEADRALWDALRACRRDLAAAHNVPPYVIFHDSTLLQMIERRPRDATELLELNGVGQAKLERYGEQFLEVLREGA